MTLPPDGMGDKYDQAGYARTGHGVAGFLMHACWFWWLIFTVPGSLGWRTARDARRVACRS